jgi:hypothetical protein
MCVPGQLDEDIEAARRILEGHGMPLMEAGAFFREAVDYRLLIMCRFTWGMERAGIMGLTKRAMISSDRH